MMVVGSVIAGLAMFAISFTLLTSIFTNPISHSVNSQLDALKSGDIQEAYSFNSKDFQTATSLEAFGDFVKQHPILKNFEFRSFIEIKRMDNQGTADITLKTTDSDTPILYQLIKENDTWKIKAMEVGKTVPADNALITVKTSVVINNRKNNN